MELDRFVRMDYEERYPRLLPPPETHRPLPPTDEQIQEKGEAYWTYPLRLQYYEEKCYAAFEKWNRKCLEKSSSTELNHLAWLVEKCKNTSLLFMDEEVGLCMPAHAFFFNQDGDLVITSPR